MRKPTVKPAYTLLPRFYDQMTGDAAAMNRHARQKILGEILPRCTSVCDLGCGTGTTAVELARQALKVFAVDNSPGMCRMARRKVRAAGVRVKVLCADMRSFRLPQQVDVVLCELNPMNHLPRKSDLWRVARAVARALRAGGYFCFDLNTPRALKEQYPGTHWIEQRDFCVVFNGGYDARRHRGWLNFDWFIPQGRSWRRYQERVEDISWSNREIRRALQGAGFHRIRSWDATQVRPSSPHGRPGYDVYFLSQKPEQA